MRSSLWKILPGDKESVRSDFGPAKRHQTKNSKEMQLFGHWRIRSDNKVTEPKPNPSPNAQHKLKHELQVLAKAIAITPITDAWVIDGKEIHPTSSTLNPSKIHQGGNVQFQHWWLYHKMLNKVVRDFILTVQVSVGKDCERKWANGQANWDDY